MENSTDYVPRPSNSYPISWFREPFSFPVTMFCHLYGLANSSLFKYKWVLVAHHILLTGDSFNWAQILYVNLKEEIEKYHKTSANRNPTFYMSGYVMDVFYATSVFPALGQNWNKNAPPIHIYCSYTWEDKFVP